jgi:hypothetical protein
VGLGLKGVPEKQQNINQTVDYASSNLLITAQRPRAQALNGEIEIFGHHLSGRSRCQQIVSRQQLTMLYGPLQQIGFLVVVSD